VRSRRQRRDNGPNRLHLRPDDGITSMPSWPTQVIEKGLAARGGSSGEHRGRRGAPRARRDDREYRAIFEEGATQSVGMLRRPNAVVTFTTGCWRGPFGPAQGAAVTAADPVQPSNPGAAGAVKPNACSFGTCSVDNMTFTCQEPST